MAELKPCPFCGKPVTMAPSSINLGMEGYVRAVVIECSCGAKMGPKEPIEKHRLISAWNRRADDG